MYTVYKATFPNQKVYIGITNNYERRLKEHKRGRGKSDKKEYPLYLAIEKYGWNNVIWEVLEFGLSEESAKEKECSYIVQYDSYSKGGYNTTKGGDYPSKLSYKLSDEDVESIIGLLEENEMTMQKIADRYEVSLSLISQISTGNRRVARSTIRKRLTPKGSSNSLAKLDEDSVSEIKKKLVAGVSRKDIVEEYRICKSNVQSIAVGTTWSHVEPKIPMKKKRNKITKELRDEIKYELELGRTSAYIQKEYKVSPNTVVSIKKGKYDSL